MASTMVETLPPVLAERCNDSGELLGVVQLDPEYFVLWSTCLSCTRL